MNTAQLTDRAQAVIAASDEYTAPIFHRSPLDAPLKSKTLVDARFRSVSCSSCGKRFGPGNEGFSHCDDHERIAATAATGEPS